MSQVESRSFRDYSLALYEQGVVSEALLRLQDQQGLDVNMLLLCVYAAACGEDAFSESEMDRLVRVAWAWGREVVAPLRQARRALKDMAGREGASQSGTEALRQEVKRLELEAEWAMQAALMAAKGERARYVIAPAQARGVAQSSFAVYLAAEGKLLAASEEEDFADVLDAAF